MELRKRFTERFSLICGGELRQVTWKQLPKKPVYLLEPSIIAFSIIQKQTKKVFA